MEPSPETRISASTAVRDGFSSLLKPPFRGLLALAILVSLVANTIPASGDEWTLIAAIVLLVAGLYLQIATTVAAADHSPAPSADVWLKEAFARRCFWRYFATSVLVVILVLLAGVLGLVIGAFFIGGVISLADPAVVLERRGPADAIARSAELSKGNRPPLIVVFGLLVLLPGIGVQVGGFVWDLRALAGDWWPLVPVIVLILGTAGAIALTRSFVALGGSTVAFAARPGPTGENR